MKILSLDCKGYGEIIYGIFALVDDNGTLERTYFKSEQSFTINCATNRYRIEPYINNPIHLEQNSNTVDGLLYKMYYWLDMLKPDVIIAYDSIMENQFLRYLNSFFEDKLVLPKVIDIEGLSKFFNLEGNNMYEIQRKLSLKLTHELSNEPFPVEYIDAEITLLIYRHLTNLLNKKTIIREVSYSEGLPRIE
jgi:hypothetical protein